MKKLLIKLISTSYFYYFVFLYIVALCKYNMSLNWRVRKCFIGIVLKSIEVETLKQSFIIYYQLFYKTNLILK